MTDPIKDAAELLVQHAEENGNRTLLKALHSLAVEQKWEEPTATEIANNIRI